MPSVVMYAEVKNDTGALLTAPIIDYSYDWATQAVKHTFVAAEIGVNNGQTRDTSGQKTGFLFAQFRGPSIKWITNSKMQRDNTADAGFVNFNNFVQFSWRVDNTIPGVSSLYLLDINTDAGNQIKVGDTVLVTVSIGYS